MTEMVKVTKQAIHNWMGKKKLNHPYSWFHPYVTSPTIGRLNELAQRRPEKYQAYRKLIESMLNLAREKGNFMTFTLHVPSVNVLIAVDIESLMAKESARRDIVEKCYKPTKRTIDLRPLESVQIRYLPDLKY
jgi:hypothetical protein